MRKINLILNDIKELENIQSDTQLASILHVKPNTISTWKTRETIPFDVIYRYCEFRGYNVIGLISGEEPESNKGEKLISKIGASTGIKELSEIYRTTKSPLLGDEVPNPAVSRTLEKEIISYFPYMTDGQRYDFLDYIKDKLLSGLIQKKAEDDESDK